MTAPNRIQSLLTAWVNRVQELEDALWTLLQAMTIDAATFDLLDKIGALVGEARNGRSDTDYRAAVRIRIRANRSQGRSTDLLDIATLACTLSTPTITEYQPAAWLVDMPNLSGAASVVYILGRSKAAGTTGLVSYTTTSATPLILDSLSGGVVAPGKLDSISGGVVTPGIMSAGITV
jgi:hypothetical protein